MNPDHTTLTDELRRRERATADMVRAIDSKMSRLAAARSERLNALKQTRSALARATLAAQDEPARHEQER